MGGGSVQAAVLFDQVVEPPAAGQVIAVVAVAAENPAGDIAAKAALAIDVDGF